MERRAGVTCSLGDSNKWGSLPHLYLHTIGRSVGGYLLSCLYLNHETKVDSLPSPPLPEFPPMTILSAREPLTLLTSISASGSVSSESHSSLRCSLPLVVSFRTNHCGWEKERQVQGWRWAADNLGTIVSRLRGGGRLAHPERAQHRLRGTRSCGEKNPTLWDCKPIPSLPSF